MVYTTIAPRNKVQEIIINIMEIVSGNNIRNRNKELPSSNQLEYLIDEWGRRKRRRIGDGVLRSNRRALFSKEWKEEKREMDKPELEINAKDVGEYAGDCHHLILAGKDAGGLEEENSRNLFLRVTILVLSEVFPGNFSCPLLLANALALLPEEVKENLIDEEEARDKSKIIDKVEEDSLV
ncbi:hypothetical protein YC2023_009654 [Brassica napus]